MKNEMLKRVLNVMPANMEKMHLMMIFTLIDDYIAGNLSESDFLNDIKVYLENK